MRTDLEPAVYFPASAELIRDTQLCTCMINDDMMFPYFNSQTPSTAMAALGLDNLIVEVDAPEIPIMSWYMQIRLFIFY